jgi:phage terminase Nu1 subunit (DNA packaging protein)
MTIRRRESVADLALRRIAQRASLELRLVQERLHEEFYELVEQELDHLKHQARAASVPDLVRLLHRLK